MTQKKLDLVSVSELKQSPAKVMDRAKEAGAPVAIVRNNIIEGYYVPVGAFELIDADPQDVQKALDTVIDQYGDALTWLAKN